MDALSKRLLAVQNEFSVEMFRVDQYAQEMEQTLTDKIGQMFKKEKLKQGIKNRNTDHLAPEENVFVKKQILMKADKVDIEKLYEIKSDRFVTDKMLHVQQILSTHLKHVLIFFSELIDLHSRQAMDNKL